MITYTLLQNEEENRFRRNKKTEDHWYMNLMDDIATGCADKPEELLNNLPHIITFNYDMSLDYCLWRTFCGPDAFEAYQNENIGTSFWDLMKPNQDSGRILHVYGQLHATEDLTEKYGQFQETSEIGNLRRLLYAQGASNSIKLIYQDRKEEIRDILKQRIQEAEEIIIIGFGFDRKNLDILGFPTLGDKAGYRELFSQKRICYMDYNGKMNSLWDQFGDLKKMSLPVDCSITRSISTNISEAYTNDFKARLY